MSTLFVKVPSVSSNSGARYFGVPLRSGVICALLEVASVDRPKSASFQAPGQYSTEMSREQLENVTITWLQIPMNVSTRMQKRQSTRNVSQDEEDIDNSSVKYERGFRIQKDGLRNGGLQPSLIHFETLNILGKACGSELHIDIIGMMGARQPSVTQELNDMRVAFQGDNRCNCSGFVFNVLREDLSREPDNLSRKGLDINLVIDYFIQFSSFFRTSKKPIRSFLYCVFELPHEQFPILHW